jgi:hypothetical protein
MNETRGLGRAIVAAVFLMIGGVRLDIPASVLVAGDVWAEPLDHRRARGPRRAPAFRTALKL